ncbi:MAG: efflux RND transporter permease subunit, partial [Pirellulales bacterium]
IGGTADKLRVAWDAMKWNLLLALAITYLIMAALFESWLYPFVIMLSVPLGAVGGFIGLMLMNMFIALQSLDVLTMLGFIILIGTVVNNPILIVEQALNLIDDEDYSPRAAVLESVRTRIRPIFMTTFIALFGLLPLVISPGAGSELYRGIGAVLLGGLVVSTIFTLFLVPCLFILAVEARDGLAAILHREPRAAARRHARGASGRDGARLRSDASRVGRSRARGVRRTAVGDAVAGSADQRPRGSRAGSQRAPSVKKTVAGLTGDRS